MKLHFSIKSLAIAAVMGFSIIAPSYADDETPLTQEMDKVSSSLKGLRKAETFADKIKLAQDAQKATLKSLEYLPAIFKDVKDAKALAKGTADYKRLIGLTYAALCELELAFIAEDEAKADEIVDKLKELKKEGHREYTE
ncbi:MAG: hypothetical protein ACON5N_00485 [Akkermansiaceae bacterium]